MRAIFGLTDLDAGTVRWNGRPVGHAERRRFGYMPEERGLYPGMLVGDQVEYLGRLHGLSAARCRRRNRCLARAARHRRPQGLQSRGIVAREPAASAADGGARPRSRAAGFGRTAVGARPVGHRRHRSRAGRSGSSRMLRDLQQPPARSGGGPVRTGDIIDHGHLVVSGTVDELATSGTRRLVVRVEGDRTADWARQLPGVTVSEVSGGAVRLALESSVDSDDCPPCGDGAGRITQFSFERRRLSEVFREALREIPGHRGGRGGGLFRAHLGSAGVDDAGARPRNDPRQRLRG